MLGFAGVAVVNWWVDPLSMFPPKPVLETVAGYERETKPWHVIESQPSTILLGNSRNYHSLWIGQHQPDSYNFSVPGATINELLRAFEHALYHAPIKHVLVAADYICDRENDGNLNYYSATPTEYALSRVRRLGYLISLNTLKKSLRVIVRSKPFRVLMQEDGSRAFFPYENLGATQLQRVEKRESIRINRGLRQQKRMDDTRQCRTESLRRIMVLAHQNNVKLSFFINPQQVRYVWLSSHFGRKLYGQQSKATLVSLNQEVADEFAADAPSIFDFQVFDKHTIEPFSAESMYWWESSHYKPLLGDLMLNTMFSSSPSEFVFGVLLNETNINGELQKQAAYYQHWQSSNPEVVGALKAKVKLASRQGAAL
ncbi:hypothetical protein [Neiella marina]|nr:hypothetical protein [Neiella marina]